MSFDSDWTQLHNEPIKKPKFPSDFRLLNHLDVGELRGYLNDEGKCETMIKDVEELNAIKTGNKLAMARNQSLAELNLSMEPVLKKREQEVQILSEEVEQQFNIIEAKLKQFSQKRQSQNVETILILLKTAAAATEEESENLASKFLDGSLELEEFLNQFFTCRKLMHLRKVKADKMVEMVQNQAFAFPVNQSSFSNLYPLLPAPTPYPMTPTTGMSMPSLFDSSYHFR